MPSRRPTAPRGARRGTSPTAPATGGGAGSRRPRSAARPRTAKPSSPPAPKGLTRRAAVFAVLLLAAAVVLAPYLRMLAQQQASISALEDDVAAREADVVELQSELRRWNDPAFVKARARERLFMVMPGETGYVVLDPPTDEELSPDGATAVVQAVEATGEVRPWFGTLWESVQLAGEELPATGPAPAVEEETPDVGSEPAPSVPSAP